MDPLDYNPKKHLGLDHDLDHYNLNGTPKFPDAHHANASLNEDSVQPSLDVIRQDKSKQVEEEYKVKDWAVPKIDMIKTKDSLEIQTKVETSTVNVRDNVVSMEISTHNEKSSQISTTMNFSFFEGGIIKVHCLNPANPSKFSFEIVEKPANLTPLMLTGKTSLGFDCIKICFEGSKELVVNFEPFTVTLTSGQENAKETLFEMNTNKSLMFDDSLVADFAFHTDYLYGIPQRAHHLLIEDTKLDLPYRFFNIDIFGYAAHSKNGVYGCIPILITRKQKSSTWMSMFWQNASETYTEVHKSDSKSNTYWISERGNLEAYLFFNDSPTSHFESIANVVGKCAMPQYFSLGYHQSRYSYNNQQDVLMVNEKFNEHEIPCDTITLDIDHTNEMRYFTWNYDLFPNPASMQDMLASDGRKLITIADPHIKVDEKYKVYQGAVLNDLCIKDENNKVFVGECWPGDSVYLDFLNEETRDYWASCYAYENYPDSTPNLFAWNDMNEPSVFEEKDKTLPKECLHTIKTLAEPDKAFQVEEREVHNLFGYAMSKATYQGLLRRDKDQNIRPHALSRSFFAGSQKWCTIWTGDTMSSWEHLKVSVPMLLAMSLCGLSFVGSDVGGFIGDPEPELLVRWYQLGTYMPYFRGHSDKRCQRREPWLSPQKPFELLKEAIKERYRLLPYWYTSFEEHCRTAVPLLRPIWLDQESVKDPEMLLEEQKFMLGDSLLIAPILEMGKYSIKDPIKGLSGRWYDYHTKKEVFQNTEIDLGMERIGCFLKGGSAVPLFEIKTFTRSSKDAREGNINLVVGLDEKESSVGKMYFDDGETFNYKKGLCIRKQIRFDKDQLIWENCSEGDYHPQNRVTKAFILGVKSNSFSKAFLQTENGKRQPIQLIKQAGHIILEFVALASKNWRIFLH